MQIKSIVAGAVIALIAGVGSVSADEITVAEITGDTETPFALLAGIPTSKMLVQEMAATRGTGEDILIDGLVGQLSTTTTVDNQGNDVGATPGQTFFYFVKARR